MCYLLLCVKFKFVHICGAGKSVYHKICYSIVYRLISSLLLLHEILTLNCNCKVLACKYLNPFFLTVHITQTFMLVLSYLMLMYICKDVLTSVHESVFAIIRNIGHGLQTNEFIEKFRYYTMLIPVHVK